jgi:hypothetical protein
MVIQLKYIDILHLIAQTINYSLIFLFFQNLYCNFEIKEYKMDKKIINQMLNNVSSCSIKNGHDEKQLTKYVCIELNDMYRELLQKNNDDLTKFSTIAYHYHNDIIVINDGNKIIKFTYN